MATTDHHHHYHHHTSSNTSSSSSSNRVAPSSSSSSKATTKIAIKINNSSNTTSNSASNSTSTIATTATSDDDDNDNDENDDNDEDEELRLLDVRRTLEKLLIEKHDKAEINRNECWFLIDTQWLNTWAAFIAKASIDDDDGHDEKKNKRRYAPVPGRVSTYGLLVSDHSSSISSSSSSSSSNSSSSMSAPRPLSGLKASLDYRAVTPVVYHIFIELYGRDSSPTLCRNTIDIYAPPVPIERLINIQYHAMVKAQTAVSRVRPEWIKKSVDETVDDDDAVCCWGWITKEHVEAFIYWAIRCWSRRGATKDKKNNRNNIKYSQYKPLRNNKDDHDDHDNRDGGRDDDDDDVKDRNWRDNDQGNVLLRNKTTKAEIEMKKRLIDEPKVHMSNAERGYEKGTWLNSVSNSMMKVLQR